MFNEQHKKESPILGMLGLGGGIARAGGGSGPKGIDASGGTLNDYTSGSDYYRSHTFSSSGSFVINEVATDPGIPNSIEYLIVAGGGAGGSGSDRANGGGGAGGFHTGSATGSAATYPVVIGGGGSANAPGTDTVFNSYRSAGGGRGSDRYNAAGEAAGLPDSVWLAGGSGGGAAHDPPGAAAGVGNKYSTTSPAYPGDAPGQGNAGGQGRDMAGDGFKFGGGGGGGAGGGGSNASPSASGAGGPGSPNVYKTGSSILYAGGGGGGSEPNGQNYPGGAAGPGGGGAGANSGAGSAGTANLGGGGGGAQSSGGSGLGGSGVVIVRYKIAQGQPQ